MQILTHLHFSPGKQWFKPQVWWEWCKNVLLKRISIRAAVTPIVPCARSRLWQKIKPPTYPPWCQSGWWFYNNTTHITNTKNIRTSPGDQEHRLHYSSPEGDVVLKSGSCQTPLKTSRCRCQQNTSRAWRTCSSDHQLTVLELLLSPIFSPVP